MNALRSRYPALDVRVKCIDTMGDARRDVPLSQLPDDVFVDAIERALLSGAIDLAVHSAKDLPLHSPANLTIAGYLERADPRDVLVSPYGPLSALPLASQVGTSSRLRAAQLRAMRPDLELRDIRGNVDDRLRQLDERRYDAIVLAAAGLSRLGLDARITQYFTVEQMLPAPGQGALALQIRTGDNICRCIYALSHAPTARAVEAERAFAATNPDAIVGALATADGLRTFLA